MTAAAKKPRLSKEAKLIAEADRLAALLADAPAEAVPGMLLAPPRFIADRRLAPALAVWRQLAPSLEATGRLQKLDRLAFAELCYWRGEWIAAVDHISTHGFSFMGKAVAGGSRPWTNPNVARRDTAAAQIDRLSAKFGLTPLDRIALNKNRGMTKDDDELPLGPARPSEDDASPEAPNKWSQLLQ